VQEEWVLEVVDWSGGGVEVKAAPVEHTCIAASHGVAFGGYFFFSIQ
jgi:hypothetical protein